jgi:hypothetical protein
LDFDFEALTHKLHLSPTAYLEQNSTVAGFTLRPDVVMPYNIAGLQFVDVIDGEVYDLNAMKAYGCAVIG